MVEILPAGGGGGYVGQDSGQVDVQVAHLSPEIARRLRGAVRDALAEMGEDPGR